MATKTITYDQDDYQRRRCREYRRKLNAARTGNQAAREGLTEIARTDMALVDTVVVEWHGSFIMCDVRGLCIRSRDPSCLFFWTDLQDLPTARIYRLDDASTERLGEFARLVLLADRVRNGGVVRNVRSGGGRRSVGGVVAKRGS